MPENLSSKAPTGGEKAVLCGGGSEPGSTCVHNLQDHLTMMRCRKEETHSARIKLGMKALLL